MHLLGDPWEGFRVPSAAFPHLSLQELDDLRKSKLKIFRDIRVDEANILTWQGLIVPVSFGMRRGGRQSGIEGDRDQVWEVSSDRKMGCTFL